MTYEFQEVGGIKIVDLYFRMADAPTVGTVIEHEGRKFVRILSRPNLATEQIAVACHKYPYVSVSLPDMGGKLKYADGGQVVRSQQHEKEIMAMTGRTRF